MPSNLPPILLFYVQCSEANVFVTGNWPYTTPRGAEGTLKILKILSWPRPSGRGTGQGTDRARVRTGTTVVTGSGQSERRAPHDAVCGFFEMKKTNGVP